VAVPDDEIGVDRLVGTAESPVGMRDGMEWQSIR
jgi:hypothetical protein